MFCRKIPDFPWYVLLFAVYPILGLLSHNIGEVESSVAYRSMLISVTVSLIALLLLYFVFRDWNKSGVLTVLGLLAFFLYGHVFRYVRGLEFAGVVFGRHTYFMLVWSVFFLVLAGLILKKTWHTILIPMFRIMSIVLVAYPLYQLVFHQYRLSNYENPFLDLSVPAQTSTSKRPDIYFIILDMYGRNDVLRDEFGYDDSVFLEQLKDTGFYVASCSQSNYHSTTYSLSATLNATYLIGDDFTPDKSNANILQYLIQNSVVESALRKQGYKIVAFETGYDWTEWEDADYYYALDSRKINGFEDLLLRNSFLGVLSEKGYFNKYFLSADQRKYDLSMYVLDTLEKVPTIPGPKFVFVHLTIPHNPFIVGPDGEFQVVHPHYKDGEDYYPRDDYSVGYLNQIAFLNKRMVTVVQSILSRSTQPPIIIVQGDHGPRFVDISKQVDILNAYYFPEPQPQLESFASPVNNFRLIFNTYLGTSLPYLEDKSYYSEFGKAFDFEEIPNDCAVMQNR